MQTGSGRCAERWLDVELLRAMNMDAECSMSKLIPTQVSHLVRHHTFHYQIAGCRDVAQHVYDMTPQGLIGHRRSTRSLVTGYSSIDMGYWAY